MSGVCTCHKHGCHLLEYNGKPGNEMNFNLEDYQECQSEIDIEILRAYTSYAVKLLEAKNMDKFGKCEKSTISMH